MKSRLALLLLGLLLGASRLAAEPAPVSDLRVLDAEGAPLDTTRPRVALARTLPPELGGPEPEATALRLLLVGTPASVLEPVGAVTLDARGAPLDALLSLPSQPAACPHGVDAQLVCRLTVPLRLVGSALERSHPALRQRSVRGELGGVLRLSVGQQTRIELPVTAPRELGSVERYRARLRVLVLRGRRGGMPALGGSDAEARRLMRLELAEAGAIWGQCGIDLGLGTTSSIEIVDPPASAIVNLGCGVGQPAAGGQLHVVVGARQISLTTHAGETPAFLAQRLAEALKEGTKLPRIFENQRAVSEPSPTAELFLEGRLAERLITASSTDPSLPLCVAHVDLNDGLTHFADGDAFSGTLEERALLRALDDGDARSVEVVVVPAFERGERIGESFIVSPGSSLPNAVIVDRTAIAAGARSFALAHELGHVLLAMPGHPDDFGVDQSWTLMDSDVADASIFGPRRLSLDECRRALTQTGPSSLVPVLQPFPALTTAQ